MTPSIVEPEQWAGLTDSHLVCLPGSDLRVHPAVVTPFARLQARAEAAGLQLAIASSFRSFERQCAIWNAKASGQRPVLDAAGEPLDIAALSPWQQAQAILRWSALPGTSRHHWGTDMDVYDPSALPVGYQLQLTREEATGDGPLAGFHRWLDQQIATGNAEGFYRPYDRDRGGVAPEPWHLSYRPVAAAFARAFSIEGLVPVLQSADLLLKEVVLAHLQDIVERFVTVPK